MSNSSCIPSSSSLFYFQRRVGTIFAIPFCPWPSVTSGSLTSFDIQYLPAIHWASFGLTLALFTRMFAFPGFWHSAHIFCLLSLDYVDHPLPVYFFKEISPPYIIDEYFLKYYTYGKSQKVGGYKQAPVEERPITMSQPSPNINYLFRKHFVYIEFFFFFNQQ